MRKVVIMPTVLTAALLWAGPGACAKESRPVRAYKDVLIKGVPHVRQRPDFCGEACAEMYLRKLGHDLDQGDVFNQSGLDPAEGRGCRTAELAAAMKTIGFEVGRVSYRISVSKADEQIEGQFKALHADLVRGVPSIVCMHYDDKPKANEHFRLVLGYDSKKDEVIYHEPAEPAGAYRRMKRAKFVELWPLKYEKKHWTLIRIRLKAGKIREAGPSKGFTDADYAQHIIELRKKVPNSGFAVVLQRPFVVVGDEPPTVVRRRAIRTIKWAADKLKQDYFKKDPADIIDIWLFKNEKSYKKHASEVFGDRPDTPFGYYSHEHKALIMNIGTGGGTLVHEIVHPLMNSNFPECPAWFNEGLASLYEQCREKDGRIWGMTNWRLAGLQGDIRAGRIGSFEALTHTNEGEFYRCDKGNNYAQARYLCYYLQENKLLVKFYREFRSNRKNDPTGYVTLKKVLGEKDMAAFQKRWERFVLRLTFP
ncbi:MAG: C39 family peptidase [Planctomycetota bacterium]|jgi:hypothetical protein